jgi:hypothetical protein
VLFFVLFVLCHSVLFVCKCVLYCCHWVATQLQLTKISYNFFVNCIFGCHPLAAVQYTFTHTQYTEQYNETEYTERYITIRIHKHNNKNT